VLRRVDVAVVGGGQAGLAAGYFLRRAGIEHVILDASVRVGDPWRQRWDSLELFSAARYSALPGLSFPGELERFPGKDEVADYMEDYAREFELPVRSQTRVTALRAAEDGYLLDCGRTTYEANAVIISTGAYQLSYTPPIASGLDEHVTQLHSTEYRNPEQLPVGETLVVGGANSGVQIAEELSATRPVHLAVGHRPRRFPRRILGQSLHWWGERLRIIRTPLEHPIRRLLGAKEMLIGTSWGQLRRRHNVRFHKRAVEAAGRTVRFHDGDVLDVDAVVWATGFCPDYTWIDASIFDESGKPEHRRGVTSAPGLYFLGMHHQYSLGSSLIGFVEDDASYLVNVIRGERARVPA
jgi:putative flavoprotein involved in K+ transport